ncbi:unnamed protein product [Diamesa tonsa]
MGKLPSLDIDQILAQCGDFHRYQFMLLGFFCLINVLSSMHYYSQTIISFVPDHWCLSESLKDMPINELRQLYSNYTNPFCTLLENSTNVINGDSMMLKKSENDCNEWIYDQNFLSGYKSMTQDLNWVCQNNWKSVAGQSTFFIGSVVGTLVFGILADSIGRLPILILAHLMGILGNGLTIFANNMITFSLFRFISGMATDSNFTMMYILLMEYISPNMRTFGLNLCIGVFYCLGSVATPWLAVWLGNWKLYLVATILPALFVPLFYFVIPESAQWLIAKNNIDEAIKNYQKIAKFNGKKLDENFIVDFRAAALEYNSTKGSTDNPNMIALFRTPRLRRLTLILFFKSMVITLCYDAISKNVEGLGMSPFLLFSLSASAIFPACLVLLALQDRIGRKAMASSSLLVSGLFTAGTGIAIAYQRGKQDPFLLATLSIIGRFGVTVAYNSGAQYAAELIPTCVRAQGVAAAHVAGYALTFFSSYILYLQNVFKPLPSLILGILCFTGALLCLFLPETLNRKTPITLEDGENFGKGEKFFHFACFDKRKSESTMVLTIINVLHVVLVLLAFEVNADGQIKVNCDNNSSAVIKNQQFCSKKQLRCIVNGLKVENEFVLYQPQVAGVAECLMFENAKINHKTLKFIDLSHSFITEIADYTFSIKSLVELNLSGNNLTSIGGLVFNGAQALEKIDLSYNMITVIDADTFSTLTTLHDLNISHNALHNSSFGDAGQEWDTDNPIASLKILDLSFNNIFYYDYLPYQAFSGLPQLEKIYLRNNRIPIDYGCFSLNHFLKKVDLSYNNLVYFDLNMLLSVRNLKTVYVHGNGITYGDQVDVAEVRSVFPDFKKIGLSDNNFACETLAQIIRKLNKGGISLEVEEGTFVSKTRNLRGVKCV